MELSIFAQLAAVLAVAAGVSVNMRLLRRPLIIMVHYLWYYLRTGGA